VVGVAANNVDDSCTHEEGAELLGLKGDKHDPKLLPRVNQHMDRTVATHPWAAVSDNSPLQEAARSAS